MDNEKKVKLLAYEFVPSGFEIILARSDAIGVNFEFCPGSKGGIWNLWFNLTLTDDPERWDDEIKIVNKMQKNFGELTEDQRLIRAQMAEFCRASPLFPESVDILCEEIGVGRLTMPYKLGCEGRNLLESLGYHDAESLRKQRTHTLKEYNRALKRLLSGRNPSNPIDAKISGFLGRMTESKEVFVKDVLSHLESDEFSFSAIKDVCEAECRKMMGDSFDTRARPLHCFDCSGSRIDKDGLSTCLCSQGMLIDVGILCTRVNDDWISVLLEHRRFAEEYILAYAFALNSWLRDSTTEPLTSHISCRYVTEEIAKEIPERTRAYLGDRNDVKVWLVTCLLKTLKSNQRWHKINELIDDFPEATSWIKEML